MSEALGRGPRRARKCRLPRLSAELNPSTGPTQGTTPLKSARERLDIVTAFEQVGTYRGAAALCGTTHKTVKRVMGLLQVRLTSHVWDAFPRKDGNCAQKVPSRVQA